jgi:hypothetical protein
MSSLLTDLCERARPTTLAAIIADLEKAEHAGEYLDRLREALVGSIGQKAGEKLLQREGVGV